MTTTLKPCPFCGSDDLDTCTRDGRPAIWCTACTATGAPGDTQEAAAEAWNRRPGEAAEREGCAQVADSYYDDYNKTETGISSDIAYWIRRRDEWVAEFSEAAPPAAPPDDAPPR